MKIYKKRGNKNYKERKLLKDLEPYIEKRIAEDPSFAKEVVPATNYQELQKMHSRYIVEDVEVEEEIKSNIEEEEKIIKNMAKKNADVEDVEYEEAETKETTAAADGGGESGNNSFIDPFNREEPIVRDYVLGNDSLSKDSGQPEETKTHFDEPTSFKEAFEIPEAVEVEDDKGGKSESKSKESSGGSSEPMNPNFDDMSTGKKKRSTKKFAKYIVEAVATLAEKGFVWYANSDINEAKLAEYEMSGEMDLSLLVSLEDGQEVTVKQFFQVQCAKAELMAKWSDEQKADMAAALAEVLMEKGVAPSPTQELLLVTLTIIGGQAMTLFTLKSQTNSLLNQLRAMNEGGGAMETSYEEPPSAPTPPQATEQTVADQQTEEYSEPQTEHTIEDFEQVQNDVAEEPPTFMNELATMTEEEVLIEGGAETKE